MGQNKLAILTGQAQFSWVNDHNHKYTVHRTYPAVQLFLIDKQPEYTYRVKQWPPSIAIYGTLYQQNTKHMTRNSEFLSSFFLSSWDDWNSTTCLLSLIKNTFLYNSPAKDLEFKHLGQGSFFTIYHAGCG